MRRVFLCDLPIRKEPYLLHAITLAARFLLSALFFTSAVAKLGKFSILERAVQQQGLDFLGSRSIRVITWLLPPGELLLAIFLLAGIWPRIVALVTLGVLVVFTVLMAINVAKGNRFSCSCFGQISSDIGIGTLTRNAIMLMIALLLVLLSPWTLPEVWSLYHDVFSLSGTDIAALVISDLSLYLLLLNIGEIDIWLSLLRQAGHA